MYIWLHSLNDFVHDSHACLRSSPCLGCLNGWGLLICRNGKWERTMFASDTISSFGFAGEAIDFE